MKKGENIFSITDYENSYFFCLNCANLLHPFLNENGEGKAFCKECGCTSQIKKFRRKIQVSVFEPSKDDYQKESEYIDDPEYYNKVSW